MRDPVWNPSRPARSYRGALNLLSNLPGALPPQDVRAAQALADVATIGILQERTLRESMSVREQLTNALTSRVVIEQAKGVLAHSRGISMEEAFTLLRTYARTNRLLLSRVAQGLVEQTLVI
ncbi:AmiR/NasT family two-component response regulator [Cryobacterium sp. MP_M5]|uniref:ANTAR domain-containing protein n=1 Tax=unclassified Cryobacterium TaxID=2649013 RepID=UPI001A2A506D|nr:MULTISPECIES: ANTAR domain-containing protein [unclassified Cryobacterium]MBG6057218.1 AmiR/NasT family two-component response regulator [Cryobacterium sp. MP_M3]MEC5175417.1 AmiR/NasT family two-component response regulator [Cryobacterium sp. MP_M5]